MSAYIVDEEHILFLVDAAMSRRISKGYGFSWYYLGNDARSELPAGDYGRAVEVANMLWRENIKSVSHRYPGESSADLPGPIGGSFVIDLRDVRRCWAVHDPVQVLKACNCYAYQSCEHEGWESSEAFAFIRSLKDHAISALSGYDDAKWGAPRRDGRKEAACA